MSWVDDFIRFEQMEENLNLFDIQIQGVLIWERIRFPVYSAIESRNLDKAFSQPPKSTGRTRLIRLISSLFRFSKNLRFAPQSDLLIIASARRVLEGDGYWWDIYTDTFIDQLELPTVVAETHFNNMHYKPAKTRKLRYLDFVEFTSYLRRALGRAKINLSEQEQSILVKIEEEIRREFGISIDITGMVRRLLEERKARYPEYLRILKKIKPRVILLAQGYLWEDIIEVGKSLGIEVVELQHGLIYPYHTAYSYNGDFRKKEAFPDYIIMWGDYWKSNVSLPFDNQNAVSAGFPYLEQKSHELDGIKKKRQIVFISQGNIGEQLSKFAVELSKESDFDYAIAYKLHPQEQTNWKEKYPWLLTPSVHVIDPKEISLYELLAESTVQIGVCSTALIEGLVFGLETYVLDASCVELMEPLIEKGIFRKVSTPKELVRNLSEKSDSQNLKMEDLFKPNAVQNIVTFLTELCETSKKSDSSKN